MKRKWDEDSEEDASDTESATSSKEEGPLDRDIDEMAEQLPNSIPKEKALNLLHSMAASKDILYWNSYGEMTYHQRRIPLTNMKDLIENALLPYNPDVRVPRGLKTFLKGLAELGINKHLISNEKLLVDLVATQPEDEDTDDSQSIGDETVDHENTEDQEEEEPSDDDVDEDEMEDEEDEQSMGEESGSDEQIECHVCQEPREFSKISIVECPTCHWHEGHYSSPLMVRCDICTSVFPTNGQNTRKIFYCCNDCGSVHRMSLKTNSLKLVVPQQGEEEVEGHELDYPPSLANWEKY